MAKDIRTILAKERSEKRETMPTGHEARFIAKLDRKSSKQNSFGFRSLNIAASLLLAIGLGFAAYFYFDSIEIEQPIVNQEEEKAPVSNTRLGDISPDLKKVEDYYLAHINLELSKIELTPENKELFDAYIKRLEVLNTEYENLTIELNQEGPNELTVNALINNLKLRLQLMYRLRDQLKRINSINATQL